MQTHRCTHALFLYTEAASLPARRAQLPPSLPLLPISLYEPSAAGIFLYYTLRGKKKACSFLSQKIACSATMAFSSHFIPGSAFILLLCTLSAHLFLLAGEPPRSRRNGNHPPDLRGHIRTYICHGWKPWIPHKGLWEFPTLVETVQLSQEPALFRSHSIIHLVAILPKPVM